MLISTTLRQPPNFSLTTIQGNLQDRAATFRVDTHRRKNVSLASREIFPLFTHLVLTSTIAANRFDLSHPLEAVTILMEDLSVAAA